MRRRVARRAALKSEKQKMPTDRGQHMTNIIRAIGALLLLVFTTGSALAAEIATVVATSGQVGAQLNGQPVGLNGGARLEEGVIIATGEGGIVQIIFDDGTRMAVGPNSRMVIESVLMLDTGKAETFAIEAISGSFRFLTGASDKDVYEINTPAATLGVRGTEFDFFATALFTIDVTFDGTVLMCTEPDTCVEVGPSCQVGRADILAAAQLLDDLDASIALEEGFPFIYSQISLRTAFRTSIRDCSHLVDVDFWGNFDPDLIEPRGPLDAPDPSPPPVD